MKKRLLIAVMLLTLFMSAGYSFAENEREVFTSDKIILNIYVDYAPNFIPQNMVFGIYNSEGQFWGAQRIWAADIEKTHTVVFNVPEYTLGDTMYLQLFSGAQSIVYGYDLYSANEMIPLQTYTYLSEDERICADVFTVSAIPISGQYIKSFANGWELYFNNPAKLINGVCMIPMYEYLEALSMSHCAEVNDNSGRIEINSNGHNVLFFIDGNDMYADNEVTYSDVVPMKINGVIYVPFRFLVEGLGGTVSASTVDGTLYISTALKPSELSASEQFVNDSKIRSKTDYMIWVSKSDYCVTVFQNVNGLWKEINSFICSIGAPSTPTITGEYEYFSRESRWSYPTYYVGPIMRFYKGYAIHSTLLRYDGSVADGRLGQKISHGCVRITPANINWLVDTVPLYTKIYITEEQSGFAAAAH